MLVQPAVPSRGAAPAPGSVPAGARDYVAERDRPDKEEPPELRGVVFEQYQDGQSRILRYSGETTPGGPDIPADAVVNDEVLIYVDGIGQPFLFDAAFAGLGYLREDAGVCHSPDYIFHQHQLGSRHRLEDFLLGGPGGSYELA